MPQHVGGSFAPPLTDELFIQYKQRIQKLPTSPLKENLEKLLHCCEQWWELPESKNATSRPHPSGRGVIIDLDQPIKDALWEHIPWKEELKMIQALCDEIDVSENRDLRNAAFHLLWHVMELDLDREPITADKL